MRMLNIFLHPDGSTAWDTLSIIALAFVAGWLLKRQAARKSANRQHQEALAEQAARVKRIENEYKNYRSNVSSTERHNDKAVMELTNRTKALEGDIRVLAEEKNKLNQRLAEKEQEFRRYSIQLGEKDDVIAGLRESGAKTEEDLGARLNQANQALVRARSWEERAKAAEVEAARIRESVGLAERKKLDAELRLKATADYAAKVGPLEQELVARDKTIAELRDKVREAEELTQRLNEVSEELQSLKTSWQKM